MQVVLPAFQAHAILVVLLSARVPMGPIWEQEDGFVLATDRALGTQRL